MSETKIKPSICILGASEPIGRYIIDILHNSGYDISTIKGVSDKMHSVSSKDAKATVSCIDAKEVKYDEKLADIVINAGNYYLDKGKVSSICFIGSDLDDPEPSHTKIIDTTSICSSATTLSIPQIKPLTAFTVAASPHPSSIAISLLLNALSGKIGIITGCTVTIYQSVSCADDKGTSALLAESKKCFMESFAKPECFKHQIAFNCIPDLEIADRVKNEVLAIMGLECDVNVAIVPVLFGDSFFINIECDEANLEKIEKAISSREEFKYLDEEGYLPPVATNNEDYIYVGLTRVSEKGVALWVSFDGPFLVARNVVEILNSHSSDV